MKKDEITLKDLIENIKQYIITVIRNWKIVLLVSIIMGGIFYLKESTKPEEYDAELTFSLIENKSARMPGSSVFDMIGFSVGSNANVNKIIKTLRSSIFLKSFLFQKVEYKNNTDYIANHLIKVEELNKYWIKKGLIKNEFYYEHNDSVFSLDENKIFKSVCKYLILSKKDPTLECTYEEESEILTLLYQSKEASFSVMFTNQLFDFLNEYFYDNMIFKQLETIEIIKNRRDSFNNVLVSKEFQLANYYDTHRSIYSKKDRLPEIRLERDIQMLSAAYAQTAQNYEIALFNLENSQPIIQVLDRPFLPLKLESNRIIQTIIGLLLGCFISISFILARKIIKDAIE